MSAPSLAPAVDAAAGQCTAATRIAQTPPALQTLQSRQAWTLSQGAGVVVAVVDSGVAATNPHLAGAIAGGVDLVGDGHGAGGYADLDGHGTALAGLIAARGVDGSGVAGLAPQARILSVRVFAGTSDQLVKAGFGPTPGRLAEGIRYAADHQAEVINVSLSTAQPSGEIADAVAYATAHGSLVVASAGNRDASYAPDADGADGTRYPAGSPGVVGVTATDPAGLVTNASIHGPHVSLAAPGQAVLTASAAGGDCVYAADAPAASYATAYVSAAAALIASAYPQETPAQWAYRLEATAVRSDPDARTDTAGWGVVQPYEALVLVPGASVRGPVSPFPHGATTEQTAAPEAVVRITQTPPLDLPALLWSFAAGLCALVVAAVAGIVAAVRRRREDDAEQAADPPRTGGLFQDDRVGPIS